MIPVAVVPVAVDFAAAVPVADAADVEPPREQAEMSSAEARRNPVVVRRVRFRRSGRAWVIVPLEGNRGQLLMYIP
ncbi:hypothetical protein ACH40E_05210 [Streptomyces acidicola]|uniref:hypothetical protein n=1 Tax=Streptomyces acidicola TaxID=2596892 RepID=UPI0037A6BE3E